MVFDRLVAKHRKKRHVKIKVMGRKRLSAKEAAKLQKLKAKETKVRAKMKRKFPEIARKKKLMTELNEITGGPGKTTLALQKLAKKRALGKTDKTILGLIKSYISKEGRKITMAEVARVARMQQGEKSLPLMLTAMEKELSPAAMLPGRKTIAASLPAAAREELMSLGGQKKSIALDKAGATVMKGKIFVPLIETPAQAKSKFKEISGMMKSYKEGISTIEELKQINTAFKDFRGQLNARPYVAGKLETSKIHALQDKIARKIAKERFPKEIRTAQDAKKAARRIKDLESGGSGFNRNFKVIKDLTGTLDAKLKKDPSLWDGVDRHWFKSLKKSIKFVEEERR